MPPYPEHEKLDEIKDQSQAIGEFLEWLGREKSIELCEWRKCRTAIRRWTRC